MGGCCSSCGEDPKQVDRDEAEARNPKPPYADWADLLRGDWGSDPTAVSRDYSRMRILVTGPGGPHTHNADIQLSPENDAEVLRRNADLKTVTVAIANIMETDGSDIPTQLEEAWLSTVDAGELRGSPDISSGLATLFQEQMGFYANREDVKTDATERTATFNALLLFAQGTVFYPAQRIAHMLWLPWARNLRDVSWTVYVTDDDKYPNPSIYPPRTDVLRARKVVGSGKSEGHQHKRSATGDAEDRPLVSPQAASTPAGNDSVGYGTTGGDDAAPAQAAVVNVRAAGGHTGTVSITHSFAVRNYIDEDERRAVPAFLVQWAVTITLRKGTGEWVGATLETPAVYCEHCTGSKLQKLRRGRLGDAVFNHFGVQVVDVDKLDA